MAQKKHTPEQIIRKLREVEVAARRILCSSAAGV